MSRTVSSEGFDRARLRIFSLKERENRVDARRDMIDPDHPVPPDELGAATREGVATLADRVRRARESGAPCVLAFGAHSIKNGLGPLLIRLMEEGWVSLLATNGAGIIHDWELAYQGSTSEDVKANTAQGRFGIWDETGRSLNLALAVGAWRGYGYGESVGRMILSDGLELPSETQLLEEIKRYSATKPARAAAAADLLEVMRRRELSPGKLEITHAYPDLSVQAAATRLGVSFTGHPMFGHDIIYTHPANCGAAIGRCAERDFLRFATEIEHIENGVYLSVGSAVMSPMIFEKSFSMAMNLALQEGRSIQNHYLCVVDLMESNWDWQASGEPPATDPAYYMRFLKTFSRMGGTMRYLSGDNRTVLSYLYQLLSEQS